MKVLSMTVVLTSTAVFLVWGHISRAEAQATYLGEFCFTSPSGDTTRFAVNNMGGNHFLLNGRKTHSDGTVSAISGAAELDGATVVITATSTRETATERRATTDRVVLDLATLNGTRERLRIVHSKSDLNPNSAFVMRPDPEVVTFIPCP